MLKTSFLSHLVGLFSGSIFGDVQIELLKIGFPIAIVTLQIGKLLILVDKITTVFNRLVFIFSLIIMSNSTPSIC